MVNAAAKLDDLKMPPGNRQEALKGDLRGFHSIRVNDQWRIIFRWEQNAAHEVRLTDYH
jgi:proteic killer suppression protein